MVQATVFFFHGRPFCRFKCVVDSKTVFAFWFESTTFSCNKSTNIRNFPTFGLNFQTIIRLLALIYNTHIFNYELSETTTKQIDSNNFIEYFLNVRRLMLWLLYCVSSFSSSLLRSINFITVKSFEKSFIAKCWGFGPVATIIHECNWFLFSPTSISS